ncbi:MAG: hypothetical protein ACP5NS_04160 [Candidatus Pacearchaeota archaeon]
MENIEVEIRSFITEEKYYELIDYFTKNGTKIKYEDDETEYYADQGAVRLWQNEGEAKIILKSGEIHDEQREENEISVKKEDFPTLQKMFQTLKIDTQIKWKRKRYTFNWKGITAQLGDNKGYGYILELEMLSNKESQDKNKEILKDKFKELDIPITPKEEFKKKYEQYKNNWKTLIE